MQKTKLKYEDTSEVKTKDFNGKIVCKNDEAAHIIINLSDFYSVF